MQRPDRVETYDVSQIGQDDGRSVVEIEECDAPPACPICEGPGTLLGRLGRLVWWRCRDCGMEFSTRRPREEGGRPG